MGREVFGKAAIQSAKNYRREGLFEEQVIMADHLQHALVATSSLRFHFSSPTQKAIMGRTNVAIGCKRRIILGEV